MRFRPGSGRTQWFRDLPGSPEMVVVPAGEFLMGTSHDDSEGLKPEMPVHRVTLLQPFAIGRFAVTLGQFSAFVDATGREMPNEMYTGEDGGNWVQLRDHRSGCSASRATFTTSAGSVHHLHALELGR